MNATIHATCTHHAGPPEKEPHDSEAGWTWVQRCLRCDVELNLAGGFWDLGAVVIEYSTGSMIRTGGKHEREAEEQARIAALLPKCEPAPLGPAPMVIVDET